MNSAVILAILACPQVPSTPPEKILGQLQFEFSGARGALVVDLGQPAISVPSSTKPLSTQGIRALATMMGRRYERLGNALVLRVPSLAEPQHPDEAFLELLSRLPSEITDRAFDVGLSVGDIPVEYREEFIASVATDMKTAEQFAASPNSCLLRMCVGSVARFEQGGSTHLFNLSHPGSFIPTSLLRSRASSTSASEGVHEDPVVDAGPLSFGRGESLTLTEIASRASSIFSVEYAVDKRLSREQFFVKGRFSQSLFDAVFWRLTSVSQISKIHRSRSMAFAQLWNEVLKSVPRTIERPDWPDVDKMLEGETLDGGAFGRSSPDAASLANHFGLGPSDRVTLLPSIFIRVDGGTQDTNYILQVDVY